MPRAPPVTSATCSRHAAISLFLPMDDQHTMGSARCVAATPFSKFRNGAHLISANRYQDEQRRDRRQKSKVANVKLYQSADDGARSKGCKRKPNAMGSAREH